MHSVIVAMRGSVLSGRPFLDVPTTSGSYSLSALSPAKISPSLGDRQVIMCVPFKPEHPQFLILGLLAIL